jgi:hypothetical protein
MLAAKLLRKSPYARNPHGDKKPLVVASTAGGGARKTQVFSLLTFLLIPRSIAKMQ